MDSPAIETSLVTEDPTSDLPLVDQAAGVTRAGSYDDGLSDCSTGCITPSTEKILQKLAGLKVSEAAVPQTMDEAYDCASAIAADAAKTRRASGEMRQAFAELLEANSKMLHRPKRRDS